MEMNPRLQVEHAITERITGIDLVKEQIKIAHGDPLTYTQENIKPKGWAIECRINAESVMKDFMPSLGKITKYIHPSGPGVSISSAVDSGSSVSAHFDSMIAKLVVHGSDRREAINRTKYALRKYVIEGVETTISLHKAILDEPSFVAGHTDTSFINKHQIVEKIKKNENPHHTVITAAISHYLKSKCLSIPETEGDPWIMAGRHEALQKSSANRW
jgi:acetyl-CoA carboxylase biotin carboxylase subunit